MGQSQQSPSLHELRSTVHLSESTANDMQQIMREPIGMATSWWAVEPDIPRIATGLPHRNDQLRALGNGQVPLCAAVAWDLLFHHLHGGRS